MRHRESNSLGDAPAITHRMTDLTTLQSRAQFAVPTWQKRKTGPVGRWSVLWPVYADLRAKGFTIREAVDWLIRESAIPAGDRKKAEYGLPMVNSRRRKEGVEAAGKPWKRRGK